MKTGKERGLAELGEKAHVFWKLWCILISFRIFVFALDPVLFFLSKIFFTTIAREALALGFVIKYKQSYILK